jgi:3-dehydroquinate synthase|tara:strand:+ start:5173 stop:6252 length:1080 start_codon:yes stop_codon:yes gene_type:complete
MSKSINVRTPSGDYEVLIGSKLLGNYNFKWLVQNRQILIVKDSMVPNEILETLRNALSNSQPMEIKILEIETNEKTKSFEGLLPIFEVLNTNKFNRDCLLIGLGGGITTDMVGFVAASYLRGVDLIQIPTTLLSQVDAAIGGKTGINFAGSKNNIGAFYQPKLVLMDIDCLKSLSKSDFTDGIAEIIKHSLIADKNLFTKLENIFSNNNELSDEDLIQIVYESSLIKAFVVSNDEKEKGDRALLNFGHTYGHAFEAIQSLEGFSHGQAVGLGMICASHLSFLLKKISSEEFERVKNLVKSAGLPHKLPENFDVNDFIEAMSRDKKILDKKLRFITLRGLGSAEITEDPPEDLVLKSINL